MGDTRKKLERATPPSTTWFVGGEGWRGQTKGGASSGQRAVPQATRAAGSDWYTSQSWLSQSLPPSLSLSQNRFRLAPLGLSSGRGCDNAHTQLDPRYHKGKPTLCSVLGPADLVEVGRHLLTELVRTCAHKWNTNVCARPPSDCPLSHSLAHSLDGLPTLPALSFLSTR